MFEMQLRDTVVMSTPIQTIHPGYIQPDQNMKKKINDFAHIPWEDTPNFPKPTQRKTFLHKLLIHVPGTFQGYVGEILEKKNDRNDRMKQLMKNT